MKPMLTACLGAVVLGGCASGPAEPRLRGIEKYADDVRLGPETKRICFASNIDGFSMNDRETVLLHEGRDRFLVEVAGTCLELDHAESIGIDNSGSCLTSGDAIIVGTSLGDTLGPQRCLIREIREWNPKAEKPVENPAGT